MLGVNVLWERLILDSFLNLILLCDCIGKSFIMGIVTVWLAMMNHCSSTPFSVGRMEAMGGLS